MIGDVAAALRRFGTGSRPSACRPERLARAGAALALAASVLLSAPPAAWAADTVAPPPGSPKFLARPFRDPGVSILQGWYYLPGTAASSLDCSHPDDLSGYRRHCGVDYRKRTSGGGYATFEVLAAAAGTATRGKSSSAGTYVSILHDVGGRKFCTRYLHLDPARVTVQNGAKVAQGQKIGMAGKSGTTIIHLHFDVRVGGCASSYPRVDPYDIAGGLLAKRVAPVRDYYPGHPRFAGCGQTWLWSKCPP